MKKPKLTLLLSLLLLSLLALTGWFYLFPNDTTLESDQHPGTIDSALAEGKQLSKKYCSRCHSYPSPKLLDKKTWINQTLPNMGPRLGIFTHNGKQYPIEKTPNLPDNFYPSSQQLSDNEWQLILAYYVKAAPAKLPQVKEEKKIVEDTLFFKAYTPDYRAGIPPKVTAIRFDPENQLIYLSDSSENKFVIFDKNLNLKDAYDLTSAISDIRIINSRNTSGRIELLTTYLGDVNPSDALTGFVQNVWYDPVREEGGPGPVLYDDLARPVEGQLADLDGDGMNDLLINEFGHRTGKLFWLKNRGRGKGSEKKILIGTPGCIQSHITDYNADGLSDIMALCTQIDQSIYLFQNRGNDEFDRKRFLQFNIAAGSSSFELHDFNSDGHTDILYTSGDNADYSTIYKPYHGVYIYLNDGNDNFTKAWFYPVNGAYQASARDFDRDGDLDIALISFFADYANKPEEGFILFKNAGGLSFTPYHHPATSGGRWIAMDVADWTGDGYDDIILANFSLGPTKVISRIQNKWAKGPYFLLLENRLSPRNF